MPVYDAQEKCIVQAWDVWPSLANMNHDQPLPRCGLHMAYIGLHLAYIWPTLDYIWPTFGLHVAYIWPTSGLHLAYTWPTFGLHLAYIDLHWPSLAYIGLHWPTLAYIGLHLGLHLAYIWPTFGLHLAYIWPTSGLHWPTLAYMLLSLCFNFQWPWPGHSARKKTSCCLYFFINVKAIYWKETYIVYRCFFCRYKVFMKKQAKRVRDNGLKSVKLLEPKKDAPLPLKVLMMDPGLQTAKALSYFHSTVYPGDILCFADGSAGKVELVLVGAQISFHLRVMTLELEQAHVSHKVWRVHDRTTIKEAFEQSWTLPPWWRYDPNSPDIVTCLLWKKPPLRSCGGINPL